MQRRTETETDNVTSMGHTTVPCIARVELRDRCYVQKKVSQRGLQCIEREIQEIKGNNSKSNSCIGNLDSRLSTHIGTINEYSLVYSSSHPSLRHLLQQDRRKTRQGFDRKRE